MQCFTCLCEWLGFTLTTFAYFSHYIHVSVQDYDKFWENFGKHIKLGCIEDRENHKRIAPLLRFFSSQSQDYVISLDEYIENMKTEQKDIYYIAADSVTSARNTPFLEKLAEKDIEVCSICNMKLFAVPLVFFVTWLMTSCFLCLGSVLSGSHRWDRHPKSEIIQGKELCWHQ